MTNPNLSSRQFDAKGFSSIADSHEVDANRLQTLAAMADYHGDFSREPVQEFDPKVLKLTQTSVWRDNYESLKNAVPDQVPPASVIRFGGEHYLRDGHHRWAVAHDTGEKLRAHVYEAARGKKVTNPNLSPRPA